MAMPEVKKPGLEGGFPAFGGVWNEGSFQAPSNPNPSMVL